MFDQFVLDAIAAGDMEFDFGTPENAQRLLTRFNLEIESVIGQHGVESVGKALWYLYGCVSGMTHDVLDASVVDGFDSFYESLESLYDRGFARHCADEFRHSDRDGGMFSTACYMLWDMDSGLEYLSFANSHVPFQLVERIVDFGLQHKHAAVQESFLHCLGHREHSHGDFVDRKVAEFLLRRDISPEIRSYAEQCRTGMIM